MFPPRYGANRNASGFTLVEVIVVIAIIATLATLLMPTASRAILSGKQAATAGAMRQIGAAMGVYAADHDGQLPGPLVVGVFSWGRATPDAGDAPHLGLYLTPYLSAEGTGMLDLKAMQCPALNAQARNYKNYTANYIVAEMANNQSALPDFDSRFGTWQPTWALARASAVQPKKLVAARTERAFLTTADKQNWESVNNGPLPVTGPFNGKRLWLFLDGSSILSADAYPPTR